MRLSSFYRGWQNEHLAEFLLSKLAFLSGPVKPGDDVIVDIYCTSFRLEESKNGKQAMVPEFPFAVQVKSNTNPITVSPSDYQVFWHSTTPYLVGVVDQDASLPAMTLYSGHVMPYLLPYYGRGYFAERCETCNGRCNKLKIKLDGGNAQPPARGPTNFEALKEVREKPCPGGGKDHQTILATFPRVLTLDVTRPHPARDENPAQRQAYAKFQNLTQECARNHQARRLEEFTFHLDGSPTSLRGPGATTVSYRNLVRRGTEMLVAILWLHAELPGLARSAAFQEWVRAFAPFLTEFERIVQRGPPDIPETGETRGAGIKQILAPAPDKKKALELTTRIREEVPLLAAAPPE